MQAPIAETPALLCQFHELGLQLGVLFAGAGLIVQHRARQPDQLTGTALGDAGSGLHLLHRFPPSCRAYPFPRATTFSASISRWASASSFFSRLFSDRKSTRLNSSHVRISYAVFCLKKKK